MGLDKVEGKFGHSVRYWRIRSIPADFRSYSGEIVMDGYASYEDAHADIYNASPAWATRRMRVPKSDYLKIMQDHDDGIDSLRTLIYQYISGGYTRADGSTVKWTGREGAESWFIDATDVED